MNTKGYALDMEFRLRNIPEQLWKEFKILCIRRDASLNEMLIRLIREAVEKGKPTK